MLACLAACATEPPRSKYPEIRAQLEKAVFLYGGAPTLVLEVHYSDRSRHRNRFSGVEIKDDRVCYSRERAVLQPDGVFKPDGGSPNGCVTFAHITAIADVEIQPGIDADRAFQGVTGPVVRVALLPLCLISRGTPSGG